jgi:hypothetical protein
MASQNTQALQVSFFQQAVDKFKKNLTPEDQNEFKYTTLEDLQRDILNIQNKHRNRNMMRLKVFLEGMEQYGRVVEVFLNTSAILCFVWVRYEVCIQMLR